MALSVPKGFKGLSGQSWCGKCPWLSTGPPSVSLTGCGQHLLDPFPQPLHPLERCQRSEDSCGSAFIAFTNLRLAHRGRSGSPRAPLKLVGTVLSPTFSSTPQKLGFHTLLFRHCPFPNGIISSHFKLQIHPQAPQLRWQIFEVTHTDLKRHPLRCP